MYYICPCPVCEQGLCRVRVCEAEDRCFACVVCDECEAIWTDPTLEVRLPRSSEESPKCPNCDIEIWSESTRWADAADLCLLGWYSKNMKWMET